MFDLRPRLVHSPQNRRTFFNTSVELPCPVCGGVVAFAPRVSGVLCGHCGSPLHRQPDDATPLGPTAMLPFRVSEPEALASLATAGATQAAAANDAGRPAALRRLYVPYWHLAAHIATTWRVSEYDTFTPGSGSDGEIAVDYEQAILAATPDSDSSVLTDLEPRLLPEATAYEPAQLAGIAVLDPTVVLSDAWSTARERWEARLSDLVREEGGLGSEEVEENLTEYSQERAALVLVPVYVPERTDGAAPASWAVDGYSGAVVHAGAKPSEPDADAAADVPQVPEAVIGGAVLVVIAGVLLLFGLWFAQRLWWY